MTAAEPLDAESTEPADPWTHWADDDPGDEDEWEPWDDYDWLTQDDGTAEADRLRRIRTIKPRGELL